MKIYILFLNLPILYILNKCSKIWPLSGFSPLACFLRSSTLKHFSLIIMLHVGYHLLLSTGFLFLPFHLWKRLLFISVPCCYCLNVKSFPLAHMFEYLIPSWWCYSSFLGVTWRYNAIGTVVKTTTQPRSPDSLCCAQPLHAPQHLQNSASMVPFTPCWDVFAVP